MSVYPECIVCINHIDKTGQCIEYVVKGKAKKCPEFSHIDDLYKNLVLEDK